MVVLDMEASSGLEITSADALSELHQDLSSQGIELWLARVHGDVNAVLDKSSLIDSIGAEHIYQTVHLAVDEFEKVYAGPDNVESGEQ